MPARAVPSLGRYLPASTTIVSALGGGGATHPIQLSPKPSICRLFPLRFRPSALLGPDCPSPYFGAMKRTGRPRRGGGKESPPLNLASGGGNSRGNSRGRRAPPSPTRLLPQEEKHQGRSGGTEPDRSPSQDAVSEPTAAAVLLRGLQQSLGRQLPGGASPHEMKRGGPGRKGTKSDSQRQAKRDRLAHEFGEWQDWLRGERPAGGGSKGLEWKSKSGGKG